MYDTIIIGAGPAGVTAAVYLSRAGKNVLLLEKENIGGLITTAPRVENFPGFPAIEGYELGRLFEEQIGKAKNVNLDFYEVTAILPQLDEEGKEYYSVEGNNIFGSSTFEGRTIILATGSKRRSLNLPNEKELVAAGLLSYCVVCDGWSFADKEVAVIGDANSAAQYALELSLYCKEVTMIALFDHLFCDAALRDDIEKSKNIKVIFNCATKEMVDLTGKLGIIAQDKVTEEQVDIIVDGAFVAIGLIPNTELVQTDEMKKICDCNSQGLVISNGDKVSNFYAIGDCRQKEVYQAITACADGAVAAQQVIKYLKGLK